MSETTNNFPSSSKGGEMVNSDTEDVCGRADIGEFDQVRQSLLSI
jgi:hypothetical protein